MIILILQINNKLNLSNNNKSNNPLDNNIKNSFINIPNDLLNNNHLNNISNNLNFKNIDIEKKDYNSKEVYNNNIVSSTNEPIFKTNFNLNNTINKNNVFSSNINHTQNNQKDSIDSNDYIRDNINLNEYIQFLNDIKIDFENSYHDIYIKEILDFNDIIEALLDNNYSKINDNHIGNESIMEILITKYIKEINNIKNEKIVEFEKTKNSYNWLKSNEYLLNIEKIFSEIINNRKYKKFIEKLKLKIEIEDISSIYNELKQRLVKMGRFDNGNAILIIHIIKLYI